MDRRLFVKSSFFVLVAGLFQQVLSACKGSSSDDGGIDCSAGGHAEVGSNHGHGAPNVTEADILAGTQKQYTITDAGAGHTHTVTVGTPDFSNMQVGVLVGIATDPDGTGHAHMITFYC